MLTCLGRLSLCCRPRGPGNAPATVSHPYFGFCICFQPTCGQQAILSRSDSQLPYRALAVSCSDIMKKIPSLPPPTLQTRRSGTATKEMPKKRQVRRVPNIVRMCASLSDKHVCVETCLDKTCTNTATPTLGGGVCPAAPFPLQSFASQTTFSKKTPTSAA